MGVARERPPFLPALTDNPILWREALPRRLRRMHWDWRILTCASFSTAALLFGMVCASCEPDAAEDTAYLFAFGWALLTVLVTVMTTARAVVHERSVGTWDALVMSRLRPSEIILGKLLAPLLPLWLAGLLALPMLLVLLSEPGSDADRYLYLVGAYGIAVLHGISFGAIGLYVSMRTSSIATATLVSLLLIWLVVTAAFVMSVPVTGVVAAPWAGLFAQAAFAAFPGFIALGDLIWRFHELDRAHRSGR